VPAGDKRALMIKRLNIVKGRGDIEVIDDARAGKKGEAVK